MSITPKQAEALEMQNEGLTYKQIADLLGITETAVEARLARARHRLDIPVLRLRKRATGPTQRQEQVLSLRSKGLTYRQIAAKLAINRETVKQHIRNARIRAEEQA